jgi:hypothetical protein
MIAKSIVGLIVLLALFQLGLALQNMEQKEIPISVIDLGKFGKEEVNLQYKASFTHPGDMNWFKFNVTDPQKLFLAVPEREIDYGIVLYDENMKYLDSGDLMLSLMLNPGVYYARTEAYPIGKASYYEDSHQANSYKVSNNALNYTLLIGNSLEKESNDGLSDANNLSILIRPIILAGELAPYGDIDFFKFKVAEDSNGILKVSPILSLAGNDIWITLYKYNDTEKRFVPAISSDDISTLVNPGIYFVRLESMRDLSESNNQYILNINLSKADIKYIGKLDKSVTLNQSGQITSLTIDYYKFEVPEKMNVSIETSGETEGDSAICLYDFNQTMIECNDDYNGYWSYIERQLQKGNYSVRVRSYSDYLPYNITIKTTNGTRTQTSTVIR